jgi:deoxyribose-phosphate aldolase
VTNAELEALAEEIVQKISGQGRSGVVGSGSVAAGRRAAPRQAARSPSGPVASAEATAREIAWRGPNVLKAAWTPAAGARRMGEFVDHTLLKAEATRQDILKLCAEARQHRFAAVCVNPAWVDLCVKELLGTPVAVAAVVGFPLGANTSRAKAAEAADVVTRGANEVDMVAPIGHIRGGEWTYVEDDIRAVVEAASRALVKVIIESAALTREEIIKATALAREAGADYVKTSTGFHPAGGASAQAVRLMRLVVGDELGVKASGGVRDCAAALAMIAAGASRIGTSSGVGMASCLGPGPLPLAELLKQPHAHAPACTSGACAPAGGQPY